MRSLQSLFGMPSENHPKRRSLLRNHSLWLAGLELRQVISASPASLFPLLPSPPAACVGSAAQGTNQATPVQAAAAMRPAMNDANVVSVCAKN